MGRPNWTGIMGWRCDTAERCRVCFRDLKGTETFITDARAFLSVLQRDWIFSDNLRGPRQVGLQKRECAGL